MILICVKSHGEAQVIKKGYVVKPTGRRYVKDDIKDGLPEETGIGDGMPPNPRKKMMLMMINANLK